ncbi:MAG: response regulator transcription factor [Anaerolineae bacterium]|nr:response regulator transcription factor [Anaerolineae bacterium]
MSIKILVIDDDPELAQLLLQSLQPKGFEAFSASNGQEGLRIAYELHPDLIVLDLMMPAMDGWNACRRLREIADIPILILTALSTEDALQRSFQLGADDFMTKPFSLKELELRVLALLRRAEAQKPLPLPAYDNGKLLIDLAQRRVVKEGQEVNLTPTEFRLLCCLVRQAGKIVPHAHLIQTVWGGSQIGKMSSLNFYINRLRAKLEDDPDHPRYILSEWGVGYQFAAAGEATS